MPIITLINDWKQGSLYTAMIKGKLISISSDLKIIDLISNIDNYNIKQAAFIFKNSYKDFPAGTIHLNFVTNSIHSAADFIIIEHEKHFFISADNGFFSMIFDIQPEKTYVTKRNEASFEELIFYPPLVELILANKLHKLDLIKEDYKKVPLLQPVVRLNRIIGHIIFIDSYGNIISNITKDIINKNTNGRNYSVVIQSEKNILTKVSKDYNEVKSGELLYLFNSLGFIEIAIKDGKVAELLSISENDSITVVFDESKEIKKEQGTLF